MVFPNTQMMGMNMAVPDVCNVPTPVGPIPTPFPNFAQSATFIPTIMNIFVSSSPHQNMLRVAPVSMGDNAGLAMGVASGMVMGPCRNMTGSFTILVGGAPSTKMLDVTGQNGLSPNAVGATLVPSQVRVIHLK